MTSTNTQSRFSGQSNGKPTGEFKFQIDPKAGAAIQEGLQGGVDAIQQLFSGFVKSIQDAMGPEMLRNISAGQWLAQVAACLESVASAWRAGEPAPADKAGELACYLERLAGEIHDSRVEDQLPALQDRLDKVLQAIDRGEIDLRGAAHAAGYFQAAAKSALPLQFKNK